MHVIDSYVPLPEKPVAIGDKWRNASEIEIQGICKMKMDKTFTLIGKQIHENQEVTAIGWTSRVDLALLKDDGGVLPFKITHMKEKEAGKTRNEGTVLWGRKKNRPLRVDSIQSYDLAITVDINDKEYAGTGKGTDTFVVRFFDKNPDEK